MIIIPKEALNPKYVGNLFGRMPPYFPYYDLIPQEKILDFKFFKIRLVFTHSAYYSLYKAKYMAAILRDIVIMPNKIAQKLLGRRWVNFGWQNNWTDEYVLLDRALRFRARLLN